MEGANENRGVLKPVNFREMGNRRALKDIKNLVGAPPYPSAVTKRALTEKNVIGDRNHNFASRRPMTRKFAASLANKSQPCHEETTTAKHGVIGEKLNKPTISSSLPSGLEKFNAIDVNYGHSVNDLPMVEEPEEMENCELIKEVVMEDLVVESALDIDSCDSENPLAVVEYVDDIYNYYKRVEGNKGNKFVKDELDCRNHWILDSCDSENPLAVVEYVNDIYNYYTRVEVTGCVNPVYMSKQFDLNEKMRAILIDWLIEVHYKFELMDETLYLTVNIIDRFLERQSVVRKKLQLVGVTAMLLACKYEEVSVPVVEDLILISDRAYTREEVLEMESLMVNTLQFNMSVPTPYVFMRRFLKAADSDKKLELLSYFIIELSLVEYKMLKFQPSLLAAAAIYTAQCSLKRFKYWTKTSELYTTYTEDQLLECSRMMVDFHQKSGVGKLTGVYRKYSTFKFGCAAKSEPARFLLDTRL